MATLEDMLSGVGGRPWTQDMREAVEAFVAAAHRNGLAPIERVRAVVPAPVGIPDATTVRAAVSGVINGRYTCSIAVGVDLAPGHGLEPGQRVVVVAT